MEFLNFNRIFRNSNQKYTFNQKVYQTKFVNLIGVNNFTFLYFTRILYIMVKNLNF